MSGSDVTSNSTPPTPVSSAAGSLHTLPSFLPQAAAAGLGRYSIYAAAVPPGNSLLCSPNLFGQTVNPWRSNHLGISLSGVATSTVTTAATSSTPQPQQQPPQPPQQQPQQQQPPPQQQQPSPYMNITQLAQLQNVPGLVCAPLGTLFPGGNGGSQEPGKRSTGTDLKRRAESSHLDAEPHKRPRLSEMTPHSPNVVSSSPSSSHHPSTPTTLQQQKPHPQQQQQQQRSPIIKVIPYSPSHLMLQTPPTSGNTRAIVVPAPKLGMPPSTKQQQQQQRVLQLAHSQAPQVSPSQLPRLSPSLMLSANAANGVSVSDPTQSVAQRGVAAASPARVEFNGSATPSKQSIANAFQLLNSMRIVLLKCFGPVMDSVVSQNRLVVSNFLQDIYRQSYFTTSNCADLPLSPESCCLLTICYLSSLQRGERISVENLRTMIHYAQLGELDWLHYYKKHKKMSESTFVQAQLIHLSRVAVYPVLGKVRIVISSQSLSDGIMTTMHNMTQLLNSPDQILPEYWVVLAVRPSSTIDFCVLVVDPLQVQLLYELKLIGLEEKSRKRQSRTQASAGAISGTAAQPGKIALPSSHPTSTRAHSSSDLSLPRDLLIQVQSFKEKLAGGVLIPFCQTSDMSSSPDSSSVAGLGLRRISRSVADDLSPESSHLVEHRPQGPFQDQYNVAMHLLQKVLSNWGNSTKVEDYRKIDFRVLCPTEASFVSQTVLDVAESGIVEYLKLGSKEKDGSVASGDSLLSHSKLVEDRVICCGSDKDSAQFNSLLNELESNEDTLYVVVCENSHLTNSVMKTSGSPSCDAAYSDNAKLLCGLPNCIILNVSSYPYSLQTNRSFVSFSNEIHWPMTSDKSGLHYCSAADFKTNQFQNLESEFEYGVRFRDDQCFEEMFHEAVTNLAPSSSLSLTSLRAQLLLTQYSSALLGTTGRNLSACPATPANFASPKTQVIVDQLVFKPLTNPRGHGLMVLVRSHDKVVGKQFYRKLKAVRDSLGLSHRFEVLFDDGSQYLVVADHFYRRLNHWKGKRRGMNGMTPPTAREGHVIMSYKELENLPCIVVLAGELRAGLSFPSSLLFVDLRLCYPIGNMTRIQYEYDTSFFNGYYKTTSKISPVSKIIGSKERVEGPSDVYCEESDSEDVFDGSSTEQHVYARTNSSSSSRKSSYEDITDDKTPLPSDPLRDPSPDMTPSPSIPPTVVEWKPQVVQQHNDSPRSKSSKDSGSEVGLESPGEDLKAIYGSTVTVTIDPPRDNGGGVDAEVSDYLGGGRAQEDFTNKKRNLMEMFGKQAGEEEMDFDLFESLNESDMEEDDSEPVAPTRICIMSKVYYCIWYSRSLQQHLLLQPAPGISWHGGYKRPPLFESDPRQQSAHYRKWTKPSDREVRSHHDAVMKEASKNCRRRFTLSGPSQVGKTGSWLLLIRLLQDHLRSSQGVMVEDVPIPFSMFVPSSLSERPNSPTAAGSETAVVPRGSLPSSVKHSRIVPLEYLHGLLKRTEEEESKGNIKVPSGISPESVPTQSSAEVSTMMTTGAGARQVVSLPISSHMSFNFTHSCTECSKYVRGSLLTLPEFLTFSLPCQYSKDKSVTLHWCVPASQQRHCVISSNFKTLERLKLPWVKQKGDRGPITPLTPVFTPTLGRDSSGLFNLFHNQFYYQLHVLVTSESEFGKYCKAWPNHLIMALPDKEATGLGSMYHYIKEFCQYNLQLNMVAHQSDQRVPWPLVAIVSDSVVMWKQLEADGSSVSLSLSAAIQLYEQSPECLQYAAMSALPWSKALEDGPIPDTLTDYDLSHEFILLNLSKISDITYNQFSFNSAETDFNLQLKACQCPSSLRKDLVFVKKYISSSGNPYPLHSEVTGLSSSVDKLVISLHHDSSSHLPHPGPYLMEHYLLFKSQVLFPYAQTPQFPVLAVDNYISLGAHTHVSFVKSETLKTDRPAAQQNGEMTAFDGHTLPIPSEDLGRIRFGGLLLYLCEEKVSSEHLRRLNFVTGASLCLVTRDCKTLVREVARLDLEERWKFRLRDEYQTACSDDMTPLFFLIGKFEGQ